MKLFPALVLLVFFCSYTLAQAKQLPDVLKPDPVSEAEAVKMGAQIFKLIQGGMFVEPPNTYTDRDNPIGIRGGGSFYSFTTGSHSFNRIPEIRLYAGSGRLGAGGGGRNYAFFAEVGTRRLAGIDSTLPEAKFFLSYKPPLFEKDVVQEYGNLRGKRFDGLTIESTVDYPAVGKTYLMRAISFQQADIVVTFQILKIEKDGSVTIAWKKLADFEKPGPLLYMTDEELQQKVDAIMAEMQIRDIEVVVRDNVLILKGTYANKNLDRLKTALKDRGVEFRSMNVRLWNYNIPPNVLLS